MQSNCAVGEYRKSKNMPVTSVANDHLISQNLCAKILIRHIAMTARTQQQAETAAFGYPRER
jgi:hypothetical protein